MTRPRASRSDPTQAALAGLRKTSGARDAEERETVRRLSEDAA